MRRSKYWSVTNVVICSILFSLCEINAYSFIEREYTIQEVLDACTNVAFGKMESVDREKQRVIVKLEEDVKGKSEFSHIRINVAVGDIRVGQSSPAMLMEKLKVGLPVIIFYDANLAGLGYVSETWFQIFGVDQPDKNRIWWNFSHIEIYMNRTFSGSTVEFQKVIRKALGKEPAIAESQKVIKKASGGDISPAPSKNDVKVLVLTGNGSPPVPVQTEQGTAVATAEFLMLKRFDKVGKWRVVYQETRDVNLLSINDAQILWIGVDEIARDGYRLNKEIEDRIKGFVRRGGTVIVSRQDSDDGRPCGNGWIPEQITGVEEQLRGDFEPTGDAGNIFKSPNSVVSGTIHLDDTWTGWSEKYRVLATTNSGKNIALAILQYGKGMYLVTALQNRSEADVQANAPLMENIVHFCVNWLKSAERDVL